MKIDINGIVQTMTSAEIAAMRAQQLQERARPLSTYEVLAMLIPTQVNSITVDDNTALRMLSYYPQWAPGTDYPAGYKVQYGGKLWRCLQGHGSIVGWEPENVTSLWTEVCESHDGSEDDPIPYSGNMALTAGLCYMQDWVVYRCIRDTGNPVYHRLEELVGLYVEKV